MEQEKLGAGTLAAALVVTVVCLAVANYVIAFLGGLANVDAGTPGAAAVAFVQGLVGALLALFASRQLFKSLRPADFWLKWIVVLAAVLFAIVIAWLLIDGKSARAMNWTTYSGLAALVGTELGRRVARGLLGRPEARSPS